MIHRSEPLWAMIGGTLVVIGAVAGASMQVLFRVSALLHAGGHQAAARFLFSQKTLVLTTQVPGICFPIVPVWIVLALALGAILFPVGHASEISWALIGGDIVLAIAFA